MPDHFPVSPTGKTRKATASQRRENKSYLYVSPPEQLALAEAGFRVHSSSVRMLPN